MLVSRALPAQSSVEVSSFGLFRVYGRGFEATGRGLHRQRVRGFGFWASGLGYCKILLPQLRRFIASKRPRTQT